MLINFMNYAKADLPVLDESITYEYLNEKTPSSITSIWYFRLFKQNRRCLLIKGFIDTT